MFSLPWQINSVYSSIHDTTQHLHDFIQYLGRRTARSAAGRPAAVYQLAVLVTVGACRYGMSLEQLLRISGIFQVSTNSKPHN